MHKSHVSVGATQPLNAICHLFVQCFRHVFVLVQHRRDFLHIIHSSVSSIFVEHHNATSTAVVEGAAAHMLCFEFLLVLSRARRLVLQCICASKLSPFGVRCSTTATQQLALAIPDYPNYFIQRFNPERVLTIAVSISHRHQVHCACIGLTSLTRRRRFFQQHCRCYILSRFVSLYCIREAACGQILSIETLHKIQCEPASSQRLLLPVMATQRNNYPVV